MVLTPQRIELERTYRFDEPVSDMDDGWAVPFWDYLASKLTVEVTLTPLRNVDMVPVLQERYLNYVFSRLVVGGCHALRKMRKYLVEEEEQQIIDREGALREAVDEVLEIEADMRDQIVYFLVRICQRILGNKADPNETQKRVIKRVATREGHRCYLCGRELHYSGRPFGDPEDVSDSMAKKRQKRAFTIEHLWSKARGGSRARENLGACCGECNGIKEHLLSYVDAPIEQVMTIATDPEKVSSAIPAPARMALLWKQGGACGLCDRRLYSLDTESLFLARREPDEPYHFFNLMAVCGPCNVEHALGGVQLRA